MRRVRRLRQHASRRLSQRLLNVRPLFADLREVEIGRRAQTDDHQVHPIGQKAGPCAKALAHEALDPISLDCVSRLSADHQAKTRRASSSLLPHDQKEVASSNARTGALHTAEVTGASKPSLCGEIVREGRGRQRERTTSCTSSPSGANGLCDGDFVEPCAHRAWHFVHETRGFARDACYGADTCASSGAERKHFCPHASRWLRISFPCTFAV